MFSGAGEIIQKAIKFLPLLKKMTMFEFPRPIFGSSVEPTVILVYECTSHEYA